MNLRKYDKAKVSFFSLNYLKIFITFKLSIGFHCFFFFNYYFESADILFETFSKKEDKYSIFIAMIVLICI